MNNFRRKALSTLRDTIEDAKSALEALKDEEQEYYDNLPENLTGGEKASVAENAISMLDDAIDSLETAVTSIDEAQA